MRLAFTEDQQLFRETVRDLLADRCSTEVVRTAWTSPSAYVLWGELAKVGVTGIVVPEEHDGLGMGVAELAAVLEEAGYAGLPDPLLENAVASVLIAAVSPRSGWLEKIAAGEAKAAVLLPGQKYAVEAATADVVVVATAEGRIHILLPSDCTLTPATSVDRSRKLYELTLPAGTPYAADNPEAVAHALDVAALGTAALLLGLTRRMLNMAVEYAKQRVQRGVLIGTHQSVQHHLANVLIKLEFARPVVMRASYSLANGLPSAARDVSMAKIYAAEAADLAARNCLQVHGAIGITEEHDLHLFMKRAWALGTAYGDARFHRNRVAADVLGDNRAPLTPVL